MSIFQDVEEISTASPQQWVLPRQVPEEIDHLTGGFIYGSVTVTIEFVYIRIFTTRHRSDVSTVT